MPLPLTLRRIASTSTLRGGDTLRGYPVAEAYPTLSVLNVPLAVRLVTATADRHVSADVRSLRFRSVVPGGFANCEIQLDRPLSLQPDEVAMYGDLYVYDGRSGAVVWQGRMEDPGRGSGASGEIWRVRAVGPSAHARDRAVKLLYIDKSIERWGAIGYSSNHPNDDGGEERRLPGANDAPGLYFRVNRGTVVPSDWRFGCVYRELEDAGQQLARLSYDWDAGLTAANWEVQSLCRTGIAPAGNYIKQSTFNVAGGSHAGVVVTDFPAWRDIIEVRMGFVGTPGAVVGDDRWCIFSDIVVRAALYDKGGSLLTTGYGSDTVTADEIIEDLLGRLLDQFDGANADVAACTFDIEQLAYPDGVTPAEVLADLMRFEPDFYWAAWEGDPARFEWVAWPTTVGYDATTKGGFDSPGSGHELYNAVTVRWRGAGGRLRATRRTSTVDALDDAGLTREARLDLGDEVGSLADAQQIGDEFLAQHASAPNAGTLTVASRIYSADDGRMVEPWEIRPGRLIRVRDVLPRVDSLNPTGRDAVTVFRVVGVDYDATSNTATLELDSSPRTVEQMLSAADLLVAEGRRRR